MPADGAGVGAGALEGHGSGVSKGERDGVPADRAGDRPGLRKVRRDVRVSQRAGEAAAVLLERHGVVERRIVVDRGDRVVAVQVPPLKLPPTAVRMARAVRTKSNPAMRRRRDDIGRQRAAVFLLAHRLVGEREADRIGELLAQVGDQARGARQHRHALERVQGKADAEQHRRHLAHHAPEDAHDVEHPLHGPEVRDVEEDLLAAGSEGGPLARRRAPLIE